MESKELRGKILGFEEIEEFYLEATFGIESPFRSLRAKDKPLAFILINPYFLLDDYSFEVDERMLEKEIGFRGDIQSLAVMCIVRAEEKSLYVNLRAPLIINTNTGRFSQILLDNEAYSISFPFAVRKETFISQNKNRDSGTG